MILITQAALLAELCVNQWEQIKLFYFFNFFFISKTASYALPVGFFSQ